MTKFIEILVEDAYDFISSTDDDMNSALHLSCQTGNTEVVKMLLNNGATKLHLEKNKKGQIPLALASAHEEVFRVMIMDFLAFSTTATKSPDFKESVSLFGDGEDLFCLTRNFGTKRNKSLLQYIVDQEMIMEREELLYLLIKIDEHQYPDDKDETRLKRLIKILRDGIPSSNGLREAIGSLQEKYPWTAGKKILFGILAFIVNIVWVWGLYISDFTTDGFFAWEMFDLAKTNFTQEMIICQKMSHMSHYEAVPKVARILSQCKNGAGVQLRVTKNTNSIDC